MLAENYTMKIISWNVNGIQQCIKRIIFAFVAQYKPDILCLQETKAEKIRARLICQNTQSIELGRKKGYSGTAIFTKENQFLFHKISQKVS